MRRRPSAFAHRTASRTMRVASPFPRCSGSVYMERRYATFPSGHPGIGCWRRIHTEPLATARPLVSATKAANVPDRIRWRAHRRYTGSAASRSASEWFAMSPHIPRRWRTRTSRSRRVARRMRVRLAVRRAIARATAARDLSVALPAPHLREEAQDLEVQPHERDEEAERRVPLHVLRRVLLDARLDVREVEDEVQRGDPDDEDAEADRDRVAARPEEHGDPEQREDEPDEVDDEDRARGGDHPFHEPRRRAQDLEPVQDEHEGEDAERERHRLEDDPRIHDLEHRGDAAEDEALEDRVGRRRDRRPLREEDREEGDDEAADDPDGHQGEHEGEVRAAREGADDERADEDEDQEDAGLRDRPLD